MFSAPSIPRFKTLDGIRPETLAAHLRHAGAFVIEGFLWKPLAKLDREYVLGDDELRRFPLRSRLANCLDFFSLLWSGLGDSGEEVIARLRVLRFHPGEQGEEPTMGWPYYLASSASVGTDSMLSVYCDLVLDDRDRWTAAPTIRGVPIQLFAGDMLVTHPALPVGRTPNTSPESRVTLEFALTPKWLWPSRDRVASNTAPTEAAPWLNHQNEKQSREEEELIRVERSRKDKEKFDFEKLSRLHEVYYRWGHPSNLVELKKQLERSYYLDPKLTSMAEYAARLNDQNDFE